MLTSRPFHSRRPRSAPSPCRGSGGFTLIELLVVIAIIAILIGLIPGAAYLFEIGQATLAAESEALAAIGMSSSECAKQAEPTLRRIHEAFSLAQATDSDLTRDQLAAFRDELRLQRTWVSRDLTDLRNIYPGLSSGDRELARKLRKPLELLDRELERAALLVEALRVGVGSDPARGVGEP